MLTNRDAAVTEEDVKPLQFDVLHHPDADNVWTVRLFEVKFEHELDRIIQKQDAQCQGYDKSSFRKWITTYALNGTDPDQDLKQFQEYLESVKRISDLLNDTKRPVLAEENAVFEKEGKNRSQWCGNPETLTCNNKAWALYKIDSVVNDQFDRRNEFDDVMSARIKLANEGTADRKPPKRFFVLGYEFPWDKQETEIRYGLTFYFEEREEVAPTPPQNSKSLHFIGYRKLYANEATPAPFKPPQKWPRKFEQAVRWRICYR